MKCKVSEVLFHVIGFKQVWFTVFQGSLKPVYPSEIIAVQIKWNSLGVSLSSLGFWIDIRLSQNQVHRGAAESAEGFFL